MPNNASQRPDPDVLLAQLREQERSAARGKLRIYFGASAGVGKTCAMLQEAHRLREEGASPLVGVVETHGREETARLLDGLEVALPIIATDLGTHATSTTLTNRRGRLDKDSPRKIATALRNEGYERPAADARIVQLQPGMSDARRKQPIPRPAARFALSTVPA